jgi:hypothetical protein
MKKTALFGISICLLLLPLAGFPLNSWINGDLGEAHEIIASVISKYFAQCDGKEARAALDAIGSDKKAKLVNFIGDSGKQYLLSACAPDISPVIKNFKPAGEVSETEFAKLWPEILPVLVGRLPVDKYNQFIISTRDQIGPEAIFIGWQGQRDYLSNIDPSRQEIILQNTPTWLFLEAGLRRYAEIKDYTAILYKQERLGRNLQGVETILVKYREKPKSIYMKWLDGPWTGRELLYNESLNKTDVRVRESGLLGVIPIWINYNNPIAQRGSNHPAVQIGLKFLLDLNTDNYKRATANHELGRKDHGIQVVDGRKVYVMENILPRDKKKGYYCYRVMHYMDYMDSLEPKVEVYNWNDQLQESFLYTKLKLNAGLTEKDFNPKNPEYRL